MAGVATDFESERLMLHIDTRFAECGPRGDGVASIGLEARDVEQGERVPARRSAAKGCLGLGRSAEIVQRDPGEPIGPGMITLLGIVSDEIGVHQKVVVRQFVELKLAHDAHGDVGVSEGLRAEERMVLVVARPERMRMPGGGQGAHEHGDLGEFEAIVGNLVQVSEPVTGSPPMKLDPGEPGAGDRAFLSLQAGGSQQRVEPWNRTESKR